MAAMALGGMTALAATPAAADELPPAAAEQAVAEQAEATPAQEPAPAPVEEPAPAPVEEPAPAPVEEPAPAPAEEVAVPVEAPAAEAEAPAQAEAPIVALLVPPGDEVVDKVEICHATASYMNPYVINEPAADGDVSGHADHTGPIFYPEIEEQWGDIIPPFFYDDGGEDPAFFPGLNWDAEGQAIYENDCAMPEPPPTPTMTVEFTDCDVYVWPTLEVFLFGLQANLDYRVTVLNQDGVVDVWNISETSGDTSFLWNFIPGGDYTVIFEQSMVDGSWEEVAVESFSVVDCPVLEVAATGVGCSLGDDGTALVSLSGLVPGEEYEWLLRGDDGLDVGGVLDDEVTSSTLDVPFQDLAPGNYFFTIRWQMGMEIVEAQASFFVEPCPPDIMVQVKECPAYGGEGGAVVKLSNLVEGLTYEVWITDQHQNGVVYGSVKAVVGDSSHMAEVDVSPLPPGTDFTAWVYAPWMPPGGTSEWGDVDWFEVSASADFSLKPCPAAPAKPAAKPVKPTGLADTGVNDPTGPIAAALLLLGLGGAALIARARREGRTNHSE